MHFFDTILPLALVALSTTNAAPVLQAAAGSQPIPNSYIVVMKANTTDEKFESHRSWVSSKMSAEAGVNNVGVKNDFNFDDRFKAYSGIFDEDVLKQISDDDMVDYIEPDLPVKAHKIIIQKNAPSWGLGRISSKKAGSKDFIYDEGAGEGITAYVVDTGIDVKHPDFGGRAIWGTNTVDSLDEDCGNHGTHVAGTIAGTKYGVAKKAKLVAVKVLGCGGQGSITGILMGINWAVKHAREHGGIRKSVMNLSLGSSHSPAFNAAIKAVVDAGFFVAVSAGNDNIDASKSSPASEPVVCTIGATDFNDKIASFSNFGSAVDLFAPGVDIVSTFPNGANEALSGTSMASPHVAGLAAYLMSRENISGGYLCERMQRLAWDSVNGAPMGTTRKLIFNGGRNGEVLPPKKSKKPKVPKRKKVATVPADCPSLPRGSYPAAPSS
ncbi:hypothetical protein EMCG_04906 [[Emmonsia] crescens]|uniref:Uncharacterized protein n=1 Tax=[Emmonsia] crescens TaxID=73230 RepID=A0A0G2HQR2_9EURO|nr:hypothetical protein EMCG_04906 [Emmonsia crescens UAMH 3008]